MSDAETITPALAPAHWAVLADADADERAYRIGSWLSDAADSMRGGRGTADDAAECVALANAALPDRDPRKITREDADLVAAYADWFDAENLGHPNLAKLFALAAKLAALLPQE